MTRRGPLREMRLAHVGVAALILAVPASAAALAGARHAAPAQSQVAAPPSPIKVSLRSHLVRYGRNLLVTGRAPSAESGQTLTLEYTAAGASRWRPLASGAVRRDGGFRLTARLQRSGLVRVHAGTPGGASSPGSPTVPVALAADAGSGSPASAPERVTVAAEIRAAARSIDAIGSDTVHIRGRLLPAVAHRAVTLEAFRGGRWATVAHARTGPRGGFDLRYGAGGLGQEGLRIRFAGDKVNGRAVQRAGSVTGYRQSLASWYNDGGSTACGFHAYYGVANVSLPCGSTVKFSSGGRTVTAVVDDRGPYVGGRTWDLNQNTAAALGMGGVQAVWSSA